MKYIKYSLHLFAQARARSFCPRSVVPEQANICAGRAAKDEEVRVIEFRDKLMDVVLRDVADVAQINCVREVNGIYMARERAYFRKEASENWHSQPTQSFRTWKNAPEQLN